MSSIVERALHTWQSMHFEYQDYLEAHMSQTETEISGILFNARGQTNNIVPAYLPATVCLLTTIPRKTSSILGEPNHARPLSSLKPSGLNPWRIKQWMKFFPKSLDSYEYKSHITETTRRLRSWPGTLELQRQTKEWIPELGQQLAQKYGGQTKSASGRKYLPRSTTVQYPSL